MVMNQTDYVSFFIGEEDGVASLPSVLHTLVDWEHSYLADDLTVGEGNAIPSWPDGSGSEDLVQATGTKQPAFTAADVNLNSQPSLTFNLDLIFKALDVTITYPQTVVMVSHHAGADLEIVVATQTGTQGGILQYSSASTRTYRVGSSSANAISMDTDDTALLRAYVDGKSSEMSVNGGATDPTVTGVPSQSVQGIYAGGRSDFTYPWEGAISFIGVFDGDVTTDPNWWPFIDAVYEKYGIDARPPTLMGFDYLWWAEGAKSAALGLDDGDALPTFPDEIGAGSSDMVQASGVNQGSYRVTGGPNSTPAVEHDFLQFIESASVTFPTGPWSILVLGSFVNAGASGYVIGDDTSTSPLFGSNSAGAMRWYDGAHLTDPAGPVPGDDAFITLVSETTGGASNDAQIYVDGTLEKTGSNAGPTEATRTAWGINGYFRGESNASHTRLGLIAVFSTDITADAEYANLKSYLAYHYNITIA